MLTIITAWTVIVLGLLIGAGGFWLVALGGSWAYAGNLSPDTLKNPR